MARTPLTPLLQTTDLDRFKAHPVPCGYPENMRCFYAPWDDVHGALKAVIGSARASIVVAMYGWDDDQLAGLLDTALKDPAMYVQISLDKSQAGGVHEKALLAKYSAEMGGNNVAVGTSEHGAIMHRKMVIVDGIWLIGGSTNFSTSGEALEDNECRVIRDAFACAEARVMLDVEHQSMLRRSAVA